MKSKLSRKKYNYLKFYLYKQLNNKFSYIVMGPKGSIKRTLSNSYITLFKKVKCFNFFFSYRPMMYTFFKSLLNDIKGCLLGWVCILEMKGLGYKSFISNNALKFDIGYSHFMRYIIINQLKVKRKNNNIYLFSIYKDLLFSISKLLCSFRERGPYKIKGIFYKNEIIKLKAGKQK